MTRALSRIETTTAACLVAAVVVLQTEIMGIAIVGLDAALLVSFALWLAARWNPDRPRLTTAWYAMGLVCFCIHFLEERTSGFNRQFPALFGYRWSDERFLAFNAAWLSLFAVAGVAVFRGLRVGYLAVLFFAIGGGVANGIVHVAIALSVRRYFPGLFSAPVMFAVGIQLLRLLYGRNGLERQ